LTLQRFILDGSLVREINLGDWEIIGTLLIDIRMHEFKCNNLLNASNIQITNNASEIVHISTKRVCGMAVSHTTLCP